MKIFGIEFRLQFGTPGSPDPCDKIDYHTEKAALRAIAKQAALGRVRYHYSCPRCGGWHLTKEKQ